MNIAMAANAAQNNSSASWAIALFLMLVLLMALNNGTGGRSS